MYIETSKDLLFVVLAFCALWITIFVSWLLYYVIAIVRDTEALLRQARRAIDKVDSLAHAMHDKVERSAASFGLIAQAFKELVVWAMQERVKKRTLKKRRIADEE